MRNKIFYHSSSFFLKMTFLVLGVLFSCMGLAFGTDQKPTEISLQELQQKYVPQETPLDSFHLELDMMRQEMYAYDVPLFDPIWRKKDSQVHHSSQFKITAQEVDQPLSTLSKADRAILYYPPTSNLAPVFLFHNEQGWVLDRTSMQNSIVFVGLRWVVLENDNPYLPLLFDVYDLERTMVAERMSGYRLRVSKPSPLHSFYGTMHRRWQDTEARDDQFPPKEPPASKTREE